MSVLYLPVAEGGQGLIDIISRTVAFRLQALQSPPPPQCYSCLGLLAFAPGNSSVAVVSRSLVCSLWWESGSGGGLGCLAQTVPLKAAGGSCISLYSLLQKWVEALGEAFSVPLFIFGPKYRRVKKDTLVSINFIFASAKLAIWKSRKNEIVGEGFTDCFKGLITARLRVEHAFYKLKKHGWF